MKIKYISQSDSIKVAFRRKMITSIRRISAGHMPTWKNFKRINLTLFSKPTLVSINIIIEFET